MAWGRQAFRVDGLRELDAALQQLSSRMSKTVVERTLIKAAEPVERTAKALAPVLTGSLRDSLSVGRKLSNRQRRRSRRESEVEVFVGANALPHAHLQEFGTINHAAQPFMRPAWDQHKGEVLDSIAQLLGEEIKLTVDRIEKRAARRGRASSGFDTRGSKG